MAGRSDITDILNLKLDLDLDNSYPSSSATTKPSKVGIVTSEDTPREKRTPKPNARYSNQSASPAAGDSTRKARAKAIKRYSPPLQSSKKKLITVNFRHLTALAHKAVSGDPVDFILPAEYEKLAKQKKKELSPLKVKVDSSEDEEEVGEVVRMSDIAAAPFSPVCTKPVQNTRKSGEAPKLKFNALLVDTTKSGSASSSLSSVSGAGSNVVATTEKEIEEEEMERPKRIRKKKELGDDYETGEVSKRRLSSARRPAKTDKEQQEKEKSVDRIGAGNDSGTPIDIKVEELGEAIEAKPKRTRKSGTKVSQPVETKEEEEDPEDEVKEEQRTRSDSIRKSSRQSLPSTKLKDIVPVGAKKQAATNPNSALAIMQRLAAKEGNSSEKKDAKTSRRSLPTQQRQIRNPKDTRKPISEASEAEIKLDEVVPTTSQKTPEKQKTPDVENLIKTPPPVTFVGIKPEPEDPLPEFSHVPKVVAPTRSKPIKIAFHTPAVTREPPTPTTSAPTTSGVVAPVRSSRRVPKPSKRFDDEDYYTEPNPVAKNIPAPKDPEPRENLKIKILFGGKTVDEIDEQNEELYGKGKNKRLRFGVLPDYIPSVKPILSPIVRPDGSIEHIAVPINNVIDKLLLDVCQDGIIHHSSIVSSTLKRQRAMQHLKEKLVIKLPKAVASQPPVVGEKDRKRKREAPKRDADFLYPPLKKEKKEGTPGSADDADDLENAIYQPRRSSKTLKQDIDYLSTAIDGQMNEMMRNYEEEKRNRSAAGSDDETSEAAKMRMKKKKIRRVLPLSEYMYTRNIGNIPESGIRLYQDPNLITPDPFYREFLVDYPEHNVIIDSDAEIDIEDREDVVKETEPMQPSTVGRFHDEARAIAERIDVIMVRPRNYTGDEFTLEDMQERTSEQPESRRLLFESAIEVISDQNLVEMVPSGSNEIGQKDRDLYTKTVANATRLKNLYTMYNLERQEAVFWTHKFLLENLQKHLLAAYLILLKYSKSMTCSYLTRIVKSTADDSPPWTDVTKLVTSFCSMKMTDPEIELLNSTVPTSCMPDVVFLLVSPTMSFGETLYKERSHESIFKWLKQMGHPESEVIRISLDESNMTIADVPKILYANVAEKIREKLKTFPDSRIVLVGWGVTTYTNHNIVQTMHGVSAIIDFAFPIMNECGRRGTADDDILLTYCPSLFVVGADGDRFDPYAMKELRSSMIETTGLVVVGHANDNLLVTKTALLRTRISQKVIFRLIAEEVVKFLQLPVTFKERTQLFPVKLNDILTVDVNKTEKFNQPQSPTTSAVGAVGRRVTISAVDDFTKTQTYRKRKLESPLHSPTAISFKNPLSAPVVAPPFAYSVTKKPTTLAGSRLHFQEIMKTVSVPEDTPQRTIEGQKRTQVEKGDLRDSRMFPSTSQLTFAPHRASEQPLGGPRSPAIQLSGGPGTSLLPRPPGAPSQTPAGSSGSSPLDPASISLN